MKHRHLVLAALASVAASTTVATPAQASTVTSMPGQVTYAQALFTTAPQDGSFQEGVTYRDVYVEAAHKVVDEFGYVPTDVANISVDHYTVDAGGETHEVSFAILHGQESDVAFTWDKKLASASLEATVMAKSCTVDATDPEQVTCEPLAGPVAVTAAWTSTGVLAHTGYNAHSVEPGQFVYTAHDRATSRPATATGTLFGAALGSSAGAQVGTDTFTERVVQH